MREAGYSGASTRKRPEPIDLARRISPACWSNRLASAASPSVARRPPTICRREGNRRAWFLFYGPTKREGWREPGREVAPQGRNNLSLSGSPHYFLISNDPGYPHPSKPSCRAKATPQTSTTNHRSRRFRYGPPNCRRNEPFVRTQLLMSPASGLFPASRRCEAAASEVHDSCDDVRRVDPDHVALVLRDLRCFVGRSNSVRTHERRTDRSRRDLWALDAILNGSKSVTRREVA